MKFPFIKKLGPESGLVPGGPLARMNTADFIDTPAAEAARKEFRAVNRRQAHNTSPWPTTGRA